MTARHCLERARVCLTTGQPKLAELYMTKALDLLRVAAGH